LQATDNFSGGSLPDNIRDLLLDLSEEMEDDFLWDPRRLEKLASMNSTNYRPIGTKHRPPIFSDYIEKVMKMNGESDAIMGDQKLPEFYNPEII